MKTTVHYISGKLMTEKDFYDRMPCSTCEGGTWFFDRDYFRIDEHAEDYQQMTCEVCLTKYRKTRLEPFRLTPGRDITPLINQVTGDKMLTETEKIQRATGHDIFSDTGKCPEHLWKDTYPIITNEGKFIIKACVICQDAELAYQGKVYKDKLPALANWLINNGFSKLRKDEEKFARIGKINAKADICFDDLFTVKKEKITFI